MLSTLKNSNNPNGVYSSNQHERCKQLSERFLKLDRESEQMKASDDERGSKAKINAKETEKTKTNRNNAQYMTKISHAPSKKQPVKHKQEKTARL
jgi:hypothetical protein